jgi:integrase
MRWDFRKAFHSCVRAAGVPTLTIHGMRRAFATLAVQAGISIWKVKTWLGHATVQVTEKYTADLATFDADVERVG